MTNEKAREIEQHLNAIDDRIDECACVFAEDGQEAVANSTAKLAKKFINMVRTDHAFKLKIKDVQVNSIGNIVMQWFDGPQTSKAYAAGKCRYIYVEIGKSKIICYGNIDYGPFGLTQPERLGKGFAGVIRSVFNFFYTK
jgi:hypothetical protein